MIKIETGVPLRQSPGKPRWGDVFDQMKPGDSFAFDGITPGAMRSVFGSWYSQGSYKIQKGADGRFRFFLLKPRPSK